VPRRDRRTEIMQATEKLFTSRRFHEITLEDVARQAGVGKGTIYQHFADKEDLFVQTAARGFAELCDLLTAAVPDGASFAEQLPRMCRQIDAFFRRRRQLFRMMQSEEAHMQWCKGQARAHWMQHREKLLWAVAQVIEKGVAEGAIRSDIPSAVLAAQLLGMLRTQSRHESGDSCAEWPLQLTVELFCNGAAAPRGQSGAEPAPSQLTQQVRSGK